MTAPWYEHGLRFSCTRCGNCCTGQPGVVWVNEKEITAIAELLHEPVDEVRNYYTRRVGNRRSLREKANLDCIFYDRKAGCTVYSARPRQCRTWPFWRSNVETEDAWHETCRVCPGSGQGELIPAEEITRRMNVVHM